MRSLNERDFIGRRREVRPSIERIDALGISKADAPQHLLDALRLRADLADDVARLLRKERRVDRSFGEEPADELFVLLREAVGLGVRHVGEVAAERVPEVRRAVRLERREELGEELVFEPLAMHLDEEKAHVRDEEAEALRLLAILGADDEAADLGRAIVRVADRQRRVAKVLVERRRVTLLVDDVEVDVRRVATTELADHHRRADDDVLFEIDQDEDVLAPLRIFDLPGEALLREIQDGLDRAALGGEVHRVEVVRHIEELLLVDGRGTSNLEAGHTARCFTTVILCRAASPAARTGARWRRRLRARP